MNGDEGAGVLNASATPGAIGNITDSGGGIYFPMAVAATASGQIWAADYASAAATLLTGAGTAISGPSGYAPGALPFTTAVAIDGNQNGWFAFQGGVAMVTQAGVASGYSCSDVPAGIALDASGNVWMAAYGNTLTELIAAAGPVKTPSPGLPAQP